MPFDPFQTQKPQDSGAMDELIRRLNQDSHRMQMLEQKVERIENGMRAIDETVIVQMNEIKIDLDRIAAKITDVSDRIGVLETEVAKMGARLEKGATKAELKQLDTFIDLINPVTSQFVTRDEMERTMDDRLEKIKKTI